MALTDTQIKKIKTKDKPYKVSDSGGQYLWATPSGGKLWRWSYRHEGKQKVMTFGRYPDVPLALARERHCGARAASVRRGLHGATKGGEDRGAGRH
jgi:hypothetical protein